MTWVVTPPANNTEADERVHAIGVLATRAIDTLEDAVKALQEATQSGHVEDPDSFYALCDEIQQLRGKLVDLFGIHKALLPRQVVEDLREGFRFAGLAGPEHEEKRKEVTERVAGHRVDRLAELTPEEAELLRVELSTMEEPW